MLVNLASVINIILLNHLAQYSVIFTVTSSLFLLVQHSLVQFVTSQMLHCEEFVNRVCIFHGSKAAKSFVCGLW